MNVLKPQKRNDVLALVRAGIAQREIHRRIGVDRETIREIAKEIAEKCPKPPTAGEVATGSAIENRPGWPPIGGASETVGNHAIPAHARSACEGHREWIEKQVLLQRNAVSIYQDLVGLHGFTAKYNSVKRFVRALKRRDPEQYDRLDFAPGEEAQVDFGQGAPTRHPVTGKYRRPWLFVMTLRYSRRAFRKTVWKADQRTWCQLHEQAFRYFGGAVTYVVLDNLKQGVLKPDLYEPLLNPLYEAVLRHHNVVADPARVCDPDRKGCVENAINHTQETALKGRRFETIEAQNEWLMHWEETWAATRIHGRTKRQVEEMFQEEKPFLKRLPLMPFRYFEQGTRTVWDDGLVEVKRAYYPALPAPLFSEVIVRIYDTEIEIIDPKTLLTIRRHIRREKGFAKLEEEDRIYNPSRKTDVMLEQAAAIGPKTRELCESWFQEEGRAGQRRMRGVLTLAKNYTAEQIERACEIAVKGNIRSSQAIRGIAERMSAAARPVPSPNPGGKTVFPALTQKHELIRQGDEYADFFDLHAVQGDAADKNTIH